MTSQFFNFDSAKAAAVYHHPLAASVHSRAAVVLAPVATYEAARGPAAATGPAVGSCAAPRGTRRGGGLGGRRWRGGTVANRFGGQRADRGAL